MNQADFAVLHKQFHTLLPEFVPAVADLHKAGLIDGWRNLEYVGPHRPDSPGTVSGRDLVTESVTETKERMQKNGTVG